MPWNAGFAGAGHDPGDSPAVGRHPCGAATDDCRWLAVGGWRVAAAAPPPSGLVLGAPFDGNNAHHGKTGQGTRDAATAPHPAVGDRPDRRPSQSVQPASVTMFEMRFRLALLPPRRWRAVFGQCSRRWQPLLAATADPETRPRGCQGRARRRRAPAPRKVSPAARSKPVEAGSGTVDEGGTHSIVGPKY